MSQVAKVVVKDIDFDDFKHHVLAGALDYFEVPVTGGHLFMVPYHMPQQREHVVNHPKVEALPHPLSPKPVSKSMAASLSHAGVTEKDTHYAVYQKLYDYHGRLGALDPDA